MHTWSGIVIGGVLFAVFWMGHDLLFSVGGGLHAVAGRDLLLLGAGATAAWVARRLRQRIGQVARVRTPALSAEVDFV
jgi:hypothetical protein